ncbi:interleukin-15 receptor subunit alpha isoform X2 [Camelus ferus]|uniref:Interleukin-15 receptor subunit alpha n=2 Tax=Camelus TaxID=9836 RepID=A0A8B8SKG2_CAMFR|nr:interleukin-15 receptor subunit alpha isoform X2 [Camelus ferus]
MAGPLRGCGAGALPALLLLLLLLGPLATRGITCPTPTSVEHANIRVKSYNLNSRERYVCNSGFKRKAGTSSLTECVFNKTMNITHWTTPNLKCIRDPSLTHQRPPPMTTPAGVTPGPESHISSGKEPTFPSKSDAPGASGPATEPGSRLTPPKRPTAGTTGVVRPEPSQVPPQTTAKALEHTPSVSQDPPGAVQYRARAVTAFLRENDSSFCVLFCLHQVSSGKEPSGSGYFCSQLMGVVLKNDQNVLATPRYL